MTRFDNWLLILEGEAPEFLNNFFKKDVCSFSSHPREEQQGLSVLSTVYGLQALLEYPSTQLARSIGIPGPKGSDSGFVESNNANSNNVITNGSMKKQIQALIHSEWRDNNLYGQRSFQT